MDYCVAALEAEVHVLCEKPLCKTIEEAHLHEARIQLKYSTQTFSYVTIQVLDEVVRDGDYGKY
ncbi:Gfo/Idh/MocA family oxidoreductase [Paenibacillus chitinolyticus]